MANMKNVLRVGDRFETKYNGFLSVVEYIDCKNVVCEFEATGTRTTVQASQVRKGLVKDVMLPGLCGTYVGVGTYTTKHEAYNVWRGIVERVVNAPSGYDGSSLDPQWANYQNFAAWYEENSNGVDRPQIDKDIIDMGNKVYAPDKCCVVPAEVNKAFVGMLRDGRAAKGAYRVKDKWQVMMQRAGAQQYLGTFETYEEAYATYKQSKESYIQSLAYKYKNTLRTDIFTKISTYRVGC